MKKIENGTLFERIERKGCGDKKIKNESRGECNTFTTTVPMTYRLEEFRGLDVHKDAIQKCAEERDVINFNRRLEVWERWLLLITPRERE